MYMYVGGRAHDMACVSMSEYNLVNKFSPSTMGLYDLSHVVRFGD